MFRFVKQVFVSEMMLFGCNVSNMNALNAIPLNTGSLKCVSVNNREFKIRLESININSSEPMFYPYSIKVNKCRGSCNDINNPRSKVCVPDVVKNMNVKVFNLMSRTNETRHIKGYETCKCEFRLDASVCNNQQRRIMINADVNAKNRLMTEDVIKYLGI